MCACTCAFSSDFVRLCFCRALYENVNFHMFCTLVYLRIVCFSLSSIVKHFEFVKALCKFPIIMIIIVYTGSNFEIPSMNM